MTPLQKGMVKTYFKCFRSISILIIFGLCRDWQHVDLMKAYIIMWTCAPIMFAYDYYLRNRKKEENKSATYWIDALKLFMVCLLVCAVMIISLNNAVEFNHFGIYISIMIAFILSVIPAFIYFQDMKKTINKPKP